MFLIIMLVIMIYFKNQATADYEKDLFDFKNDRIDGEKIDILILKN